MAPRSELEARRTRLCRLTPDRALGTLEDAVGFLHDRGLLTLMPDCSLPSLFAACHEEPYRPGRGGFAQWPRTKWWWAGALGQRSDVVWLRIHRGKGLLVSPHVAGLADPLCRSELARAADGAHGEDARRLVEHLAAAGPTLLEEAKDELGLDSRRLRSARTRLERVGALVPRGVKLDRPNGGHVHTSELARWDQRFPEPTPGGIEELVVAGVRAAVLVPEDEPGRWFSWPLPPGTTDVLVANSRLTRVDGFLALS